MKAATRAADLGLSSWGKGNSRSFAPVIHAEPEALVGNQTAELEDTRGDPNVITHSDEEEAAFEARMNWFIAACGKRTTVPIEKLGPLHIEQSIPERLKSGSYEYSNEQTVLTQGDLVVTRQKSMSKARVLAYVKMMRNGDDITAIQVTDIVPGGGVWHLNGLHRLVAARIVGRDMPAGIWR